MEQKFVKVTFELELAKRIQNKECDGRIVTRDGKKARIVCWDAEGRDDYILALLFSENREYPVNFMPNGCMVKDERTKSDLMLEIPEYMTFKDGDVIAYDSFDTISITMADVIRKVKDVFAHYYAELRDGRLYFYEEDVKDVLSVGARLATETEKQKLIDALKGSKEPKAKEYLKRFFNIEQKQEYEFKPFDKVLVRDDYENSKWSCNLFCEKSEDGTYSCVGGYWDMCIPYEGNEHLLGTTNEFEEK